MNRIEKNEYNFLDLSNQQPTPTQLNHVDNQLRNLY